MLPPLPVAQRLCFRRCQEIVDYHRVFSLARLAVLCFLNSFLPPLRTRFSGTPVVEAVSVFLLVLPLLSFSSSRSTLAIRTLSFMFSTHSFFHSGSSLPLLLGPARPRLGVEVPPSSTIDIRLTLRMLPVPLGPTLELEFGPGVSIADTVLRPPMGRGVCGT